MSGTYEGGKKTEATNKKKYGPNYYRKIGALGGKKSTGGGFTKMDPDKLREVGAKGGRTSRRAKKVTLEEYDLGYE